MDFNLDLDALMQKTPHEIMSAVSGAMWAAGVSEDSIVEYSEKVIEFTNAEEAIAYTAGFLQKV